MKTIKVLLLMLMLLEICIASNTSSALSIKKSTSTRAALTITDLKDSVSNMKLLLDSSIRSYMKKAEPRKLIWLQKMIDNKHLMQRSVPPSITIAQACLETGYGKYSIGHNIFGIKGKGIYKKTTEYVNGKYVIIVDEFKYFPSINAALNYHEKILLRYKVEGDYRVWARAIQQGGYSTSPVYQHRLLHILEGTNLYLLDNIKAVQAEIDFHEASNARIQQLLQRYAI